MRRGKAHNPIRLYANADMPKSDLLYQKQDMELLHLHWQQQP